MALLMAHRGYVLQTSHIMLADRAGTLNHNEPCKKLIWGWIDLIQHHL